VRYVGGVVGIDTNTPSFGYLFNIFPHEGVYRVKK
jgi:hypothetical protein